MKFKIIDFKGNSHIFNSFRELKAHLIAWTFNNPLFLDADVNDPVNSVNFKVILPRIQHCGKCVIYSNLNTVAYTM